MCGCNEGIIVGLYNGEILSNTLISAVGFKLGGKEVSKLGFSDRSSEG